MSSPIIRFCFFWVMVIGTWPVASKQLLAEPMITLQGSTMGSYYQIKFYGLRPIPIHDQIEATLEKINQQMSTYIRDSEISRFNQSASTDWQTISREFFEVALLSKTVHRMTRGTFEPTLEALVNLWGFGPKHVPVRVPDTGSLQQALKRIGYDKIHLAEERSAIRKDDPKLTIDFSAIAKGYAVDEIAELLESFGLTRYLVEIGGDLRTGKPKPDGSEWAIAIERPSPGSGPYLRAIFPKGYGVATSGDYRNYFEIDGRRYSHIIDPTTGFPIENNVASVTVASRTCAKADGLATAFMVMGYELGMRIAQEYEIPVYWVLREDETFRETHSVSFEKFLEP